MSLFHKKQVVMRRWISARLPKSEVAIISAQALQSTSYQFKSIAQVNDKDWLEMKLQGHKVQLTSKSLRAWVEFVASHIAIWASSTVIAVDQSKIGEIDLDYYNNKLIKMHTGYQLSIRCSLLNS